MGMEEETARRIFRYCDQVRERERKLGKYPFLLQMNSISAGPGKNYFGRLQESHIEEKCEELRAVKLCIQ